MKKSLSTLLAVLFLAQAALVTAQTSTPAPTPDSGSVVGTIIGVVAVIVVFAFIAYAGYRVLKKWGSGSQAQQD